MSLVASKPLAEPESENRERLNGDEEATVEGRMKVTPTHNTTSRNYSPAPHHPHTITPHPLPRLSNAPEPPSQLLALSPLPSRTFPCPGASPPTQPSIIVCRWCLFSLGMLSESATISRHRSCHRTAEHLFAMPPLLELRPPPVARGVAGCWSKNFASNLGSNGRLPELKSRGGSARFNAEDLYGEFKTS